MSSHRARPLPGPHLGKRQRVGLPEGQLRHKRFPFLLPVPRGEGDQCNNLNLQAAWEQMQAPWSRVARRRLLRSGSPSRLLCPPGPQGHPVTSRGSAGQAGLRGERVALHLAHKLTADGCPTCGPGGPTNIPGAWPPAPFASSPELSLLVGSSQHGQYPSWALLIDSWEPVSAQQHLCSPGGSPGPTPVSGGSSWPGPHTPSGFSCGFAALLLRPFLLLTAPHPTLRVTGREQKARQGLAEAGVGSLLGVFSASILGATWTLGMSRAAADG